MISVRMVVFEGRSIRYDENDRGEPTRARPTHRHARRRLVIGRRRRRRWRRRWRHCFRYRFGRSIVRQVRCLRQGFVVSHCRRARRLHRFC